MLFDLLPATTRSPLAYTEAAPRRSGNALFRKPYRVLVIGQKRAAGSVAALTPTRIYSVAQARASFGAGSQLSEMLRMMFLQTSSHEVVAIGLADAGGAVAEVRTVTIGGSPTAAGVLAVYFGGHRVAVPVALGETPTTTVANLLAEMNLNADVPFSAAAALGVLTVTARNGGTLGSEISIQHSWGANESLPAGMTFAVAVTTPGSGAVSYGSSAVMGLVANEHFDVIAAGANDATNLGVITADLLDRWSPVRQLEGAVATGFSGNHAAALAQGLLLNSEFSAQLPAYLAPEPSWCWGAALAGQLAIEAQQDPARGYNTVRLRGLKAPKNANRYTPTEQELQLHGGMSTWNATVDGGVELVRVISNYRVAAGGSADSTYLDLNTVLTLAFLRYDWRTNWKLKYPRHKLANDGTHFAPGQPVMTPERGRAEATAWYSKLEAAGLVEDMDGFKANLVVERNSDDPTRLDFLLIINLVNQLQIVAARFEFTV